MRCRRTGAAPARRPGGPPQRGVYERHLVHVLDEEVERPAARAGAEGVARQEREACGACPRACTRCRRASRCGSAAGPAAAEQRDLVPARREPAEDLVQVDLGAAGLRIVAVLPVDEEQPHYMRPMRRARASSTPFTNFALAALP